MKDIFKVAGILLGGFALGSIVQAMVDQKRIDKVYDKNNGLIEKYNALADQNMALQRDLEIAKVTNHQVATYACNLKKQLDSYEDF